MSGPTEPDGPDRQPTAELTRRLATRLADAQREQRLPAVAAEVRRGAVTLWSAGIHAGPQHAFRIGSITKTFTAAAVLQCRDAGLLDLDDEVSDHLPVALPRGTTVRRCLSHLAGVQREPDGDVWAGGPVPDEDALLAGVARTTAASPPARRFHYSNLGFALLGRVVAERREMPWYDAVSASLLAPLGLARTTLGPTEPAATGGFTHPWSDAVTAEPDLPTGGAAPAAQLWSTAADIARWGAFLAAPDPAVLAPATVAEMSELAVLADTARWSVGYGLGLILYRRGERVLLGHGGAMPGFLSALVVDPVSGTAAAVLTAAGRGAAPDELAGRLVEDALELSPPPQQPWTPAAPPPADVAALLGPWWTEGSEVVLTWHDRLEARLAAAPAWREPAVFERLAAPAPDGVELWRTVSGREAGELLRVTRDAAGAVAALHWATYALTRAPLSFAELLAGDGRTGSTGP